MKVEELVEKIKAKVKGSLGSKRKKKKPYVKMDKSASIKVEIRSRKARQLIEKTLAAADDKSAGAVGLKRIVAVSCRRDLALPENLCPVGAAKLHLGSKTCEVITSDVNCMDSPTKGTTFHNYYWYQH